MKSRSFSRPCGSGDCTAVKTLTKTEEEETIIINRPDGSTYLGEKSVSRSGATPDGGWAAILIPSPIPNKQKTLANLSKVRPHRSNHQRFVLHPQDVAQRTWR